MKKKSESDSLNEMINLLQNKQAQELELLKGQFHVIYESLKPINLIKATFHELASSPEIKNNIVNNVIGLTTGYLSKKVLLGTSRNPIKNISGTVLQFAISNIVSKHSDTITSTGKIILKSIFKSKNETPDNNNSNGNWNNIVKNDLKG